MDLDRLATETLKERSRTNFIRLDGVFLPQQYKEFAKTVENFEVLEDDIWVCSFQRSG